MECKSCGKRCTYALLARFTQKSNPRNAKAIGHEGVKSLGDLVKMLKNKKVFMQEMLQEHKNFAIALDGDRDRAGTEYVIIAEVVTLCGLFEREDPIKYCWLYWDNPNQLHQSNKAEAVGQYLYAIYPIEIC